MKFDRYTNRRSFFHFLCKNVKLLNQLILKKLYFEQAMIQGKI